MNREKLKIQPGSHEVKKVIPYLRLTAFLNSNSSLKCIIDRSKKMVPGYLIPALEKVSKYEIEKAINNKEANGKAYRTLCLIFLSKILSRDGWKIIGIRNSFFEDNIFGFSLKKYPGKISDGPLKGGAFIARKSSRKIHFYFSDKISGNIKKKNSGNFKEIDVMIVPSEEDMNLRRQVENANKWPGAFFVCLEQIRKKIEEINPAEYLKWFGPTPSVVSEGRESGKIDAFKAEVVANIPVGGGTKNHFKLRFRAHGMPWIIPGQFIMMDTAPLGSATKNINVSARKKKDFLNLVPETFLKRPFGIHRSFYPNFEHDYLRKLSLPPTLAAVTHTVFPHEFDILYKVLENGVGTNELKTLKKGHKVSMTGPLGKKFDLRELKKEGFEEIHIIGGGVGMAPLVFMAQALRFYAFKIRAFIGIENFEALKHSDDLFSGFVEDPKDVKLYVDDLLVTGMGRSDIYVSCDKPGGPGKIIPKGNFHHGFISELYEEYLQQRRGEKKTLAFTCGPMAMMKEINHITRKNNITLKAFMEKRMACGIGVCLSCVCKTVNGKEQYSRVCVDGPIFDAREIVWQ